MPITVQKITKLGLRIDYEHEIQPDDTPVRGNAQASGDDALDKAAEDLILAQLDAGEIHAWCGAIVTAKVEIDGQIFKGSASLWGCSYDSESSLWRDVGEDLENEARDSLLDTIHHAIGRGVVARKALEGFPERDRGPDQCAECGRRFTARKSDKRPICPQCK
jgi:hypothetical protein